MRNIIFALLALAFFAVPASGETLLPVVTVAGPVVHVGDIFAGAGAHAGDAIVPSPPPGTQITYGADWLRAVAREHGLAWQPGSNLDQVTIARASRVVDDDAIADALLRAIGKQESIANATLKLDTPGLNLVVPAEAPQGIAIDDLSIDRRSGFLSAYVSAPPDDPAATRRRVTGRIVFRVAVPVLSHAVAPGETITAVDLDSIMAERDRLAPDSVTDPSQLIGKTPRRALAPEMPVRLGDLAEPVLVHRNELVTWVLETGNLRLTSEGKALDDGAEGALVRVENTKSNRIIDATVISAGVATVATPGNTLSAQLAEQ